MREFMDVEIYGLRLGDSRDKVKRLWGLPSHKCPVNQAEEWRWLETFPSPDYVRFIGDQVTKINGDRMSVAHHTFDPYHSQELVLKAFPDLALETELKVCNVFSANRNGVQLSVAFFIRGGNKYTLQRSSARHQIFREN